MPQTAISAIQAMLAPVVLMTTSAILAGGMQTMYAEVNDRMRRSPLSGQSPEPCAGRHGFFDPMPVERARRFSDGLQSGFGPHGAFTRLPVRPDLEVTIRSEEAIEEGGRQCRTLPVRTSPTCAMPSSSRDPRSADG